MLFPLLTLNLTSVGTLGVHKEATVTHWILRDSCFVVLLLLIAQAVWGQEFSADVVNNKPGAGGKLSKVYATKDKVRFEVASDNAAMGPSAVILDDARHIHTLVMPERHMYMDVPTPTVKYIITNYWRVQDVNDACPAWKKMTEEMGTTKTGAAAPRWAATA